MFSFFCGRCQEKSDHPANLRKIALYRSNGIGVSLEERLQNTLISSNARAFNQHSHLREHRPAHWMSFGYFWAVLTGIAFFLAGSAICL
jgi:hypothetical protein